MTWVVKDGDRYWSLAPGASWTASQRLARRYHVREAALFQATFTGHGLRIVRLVPKRKRDDAVAKACRSARDEERGALLERELVAAWLERTCTSGWLLASQVREGSHRVAK